MGNHTQNKISMDVAADSSSLDSLSFAGLLCIQDQQSKSPNRTGYQDNTDDQEFEFVSGTLGKSPHNLKENSHPDMLENSDNHHLLPLELLLKSAQSEAANKPGYKKSRPPSLGSHANQTIVSHETNEEAKNQVKRKQAASRSFGQKLFQSFVSPCRECHAVRPTMKAHAASQKSTKSQ
ncbi:hypothetical protein DITRI_Ditri02bG0035000 [Diplodiscus trichospermus]